MLSQNLAQMVWRVSLPIIFVEATETLDHLIDTLFLSRVGMTELGAIAVADSVMLLFLLLPLALVVARQRQREERALPRWPWLAAWVALLLAAKLASAYWPTHKDAAGWAAAIRERAHATVREVVSSSETWMS